MPAACRGCSVFVRPAALGSRLHDDATYQPRARAATSSQPVTAAVRRALITGSNRGIGLALYDVLAERGDDMLAACRRCSPELDAVDVRGSSMVLTWASRKPWIASAPRSQTNRWIWSSPTPPATSPLASTARTTWT